MALTSFEKIFKDNKFYQSGNFVSMNKFVKIKIQDKKTSKSISFEQYLFINFKKIDTLMENIDTNIFININQ